MRVGIFTDTYKPQVNGVVSSIVTLERELRKKGHKVFIITTTDPDVNSPEPNVLRLPSLEFKPLPQYRLGMVYSARSIRRIRTLRLDIIHSQTEWGVGTFSRFVSKQLRIPLVHTYHTLYEYYTHYVTKGYFTKSSKRIARQISKFYCSKCNNLIVPTRKVQKIIESYGAKNHINIVPTGIVLDRFYRKNYTNEQISELRNRYADKDDFLCVCIGRIAREKSLDVLIEMFSKVKDEKVRLLIVGRGPIIEELVDQTIALGIEKRVIFTGEVPYQDVAMYYHIGDLFLNASISETQGLTFVEAMAAEIPVNARFDDNLVDLLTSNNAGLLYNNEEEFLENIKKIREDKEFKDEMVNKAFKVSQDFTAEKFGDSVEEVYLKTIKEYDNGEDFTLFRGKKLIQQIRSWKGFRTSDKGPWNK